MLYTHKRKEELRGRWEETHIEERVDRKTIREHKHTYPYQLDKWRRMASEGSIQTHKNSRGPGPNKMRNSKHCRSVDMSTIGEHKHGEENADIYSTIVAIPKVAILAFVCE